MFNKTKLKIRNRIKDWLGITKLEYDVKDNWDKISSRIYEINGELHSHQKQINAIHTTIESILHIGTDVEEYDKNHSWAVICIEGNLNIVKFVDLRGQNTREILNFLKRYEAARHCIDTPYSPMFYDDLVFKLDKK